MSIDPDRTEKGLKPGSARKGALFSLGGPTMSKQKSKRGFAAMDPGKQREIASRGGKAAQRKGKAHKWTREEAVDAGRKGGQAVQAAGTGNRFDSESGKAAARKRKRI